MGDIYEIDTDSVKSAVSILKQKSSEFQNVNKKYKSSYIATGPDTVKAINNKFNIEEDYSKCLQGYASLSAFVNEYYENILALEDLLQEIKNGKLSSELLQCISGLDGLLYGLDFDGIDINSVMNEYRENGLDALTKFDTEEELAFLVYLTGAYTTNKGISYRANYNANTGAFIGSSSVSRGRQAAYLTKLILNHATDSDGYHHNGMAVKKANTFKKMYDRKEISCSQSVSIVLQGVGVLKPTDMIAHTPGKGKEGWKPWSSDVKSRFSGSEKLKNCTLVHFYEGEKSSFKSIDKSCEVEQVKITKNKYYTYDELPAKYKKPGTVYIQDSNASINVGNDTLVSFNKSGQSYAGKKDSIMYERGEKSYARDREICDIIIPN